MKKFRLLIIPALSLAVGLGLAGCGRSTHETADADDATAETAAEAVEQVAAISALPELGKAPDWELRRLDGSLLKSSELAGKVVVLDFWATWCGPCRKEIPGYVDMQEQYADDGLVVVGVSLDQTGPSIVSEFGHQYGINYPLVMGDERMVELFGGIQYIPTTFLIDRDGQVRHRKSGALAREDYEPLITSLL